jgi:hypothetical protein
VGLPLANVIGGGNDALRERGREAWNRENPQEGSTRERRPYQYDANDTARSVAERKPLARYRPRITVVVASVSTRCGGTFSVRPAIGSVR